MDPITLTNFRGGRNGIDSVIDPGFPTNQVVEAFNVEFDRAPLGERRGGSTSWVETGGTPFSGPILSLLRFMPAGNDLDAQVFAMDGSAQPNTKRIVAGVGTDVSYDDPPVSGYENRVEGVSFNGKFVLFYNSAVDRLHVYDPLVGVVRRHGLATVSNVPTVANQGAGTYAAVARYYRVRFLQMNGAVIVRRSEATPASAVFTPSGAGAAARVTLAAAPGERETHWEVEVSLNGTIWNVLAGSKPLVSSGPIAIGTSFYDDTTVTTAYTSLSPSDLLGLYTLFPSMRFGITDGNRLIGTGSFLTATTPQTSRIWFSPVLGSDDAGDDERWVNISDLKTRMDITEKDGGEVTGIVGAINGIFWVTKFSGTWRFVPTENLVKPYIFRKISSTVGCMGHRTMVMGEDYRGNPAAYWLDSSGPIQVGLEGLSYLGRDIEDIWQGHPRFTATGLFDPIRSAIVGAGQAAWAPAHGCFHKDRKQVYWWVTPTSQVTPTIRLRLCVKQAVRRDEFGIRGGWLVDGGLAAQALCSCSENDPNNVLRQTPAFGYTGGILIVQSDTTDRNDIGTPFFARWISKSLRSSEFLGRVLRIVQSVGFFESSPTVVRLSIVPNYDLTKVVDADIMLDSPTSPSSPFVVKQFDAGTASDVGILQLQFGDPFALTQPVWKCHALTVMLDDDGDQQRPSNP